MVAFLTETTAYELAQKRANERGLVHEVWCHDGDWGHPDGDIVGTRAWKVTALGVKLPRGWVFRGLARPEVLAK